MFLFSKWPPCTRIDNKPVQMHSFIQNGTAPWARSHNPPIRPHLEFGKNSRRIARLDYLAQWRAVTECPAEDSL
jgi:hypothetical protein